jgi:hypothetical protein
MVQVDQETLQAGDMVQLNSGSPDWKVLSVTDGNVTLDVLDPDGNKPWTLPAVCVTRTRQATSPLAS